LLSVSEGTVRRWIKQDGMPFEKVEGQLRFHRARLLEWATARQITLPADFMGGPPEGVAAALRRGGVHAGLAAADKAAALRALVEATPLPVDRGNLLSILMAREAMASTGDGIAIPHVRNPVVLNVNDPAIALGFLTQPIEFGALDGKPVHTLFLLISPTVQAHLQLLSRLAFVLRNDGFKKALALRLSEPILKAAQQVESEMK
jgi:PTS system nitrogen regulatory IIA component